MSLLKDVESVNIKNSLQTRLFEVSTAAKVSDQIQLEIKNTTKYPLPVKPIDKLDIADVDGYRYSLDLKNSKQVSSEGFWLEPSNSYLQTLSLNQTVAERCRNSPCRIYFRFQSQVADIEQGLILIDC